MTSTNQPTNDCMKGASSGGGVVAPRGSLQVDELVTLHPAGLGSIPNTGTANTTIASLWRDTTTRGRGVTPAFSQVTGRQSQALPGEAQSSPFRKLEQSQWIKHTCIYTVVVACISLYCEGSGYELHTHTHTHTHTDCMEGSNGRHCSTQLAIFLLGQRLPNLPCSL
jgi:hypothetical protein